MKKQIGEFLTIFLNCLIAVSLFAIFTDLYHFKVNNVLVFSDDFWTVKPYFYVLFFAAIIGALLLEYLVVRTLSKVDFAKNKVEE